MRACSICWCGCGHHAGLTILAFGVERSGEKEDCKICLCMMKPGKTHDIFPSQIRRKFYSIVILPFSVFHQQLHRHRKTETHNKLPKSANSMNISWAKLGTSRQLFQVISIDKNHLRYESFNALGELHDSFELEK